MMKILLRMIYGYLTAASLFLMTEYILTRVFPPDHWLTIKELKVSNPVYQGEPLAVEYIFNVFRTLHVETVDSVYCRLPPEPGIYFMSHHIYYDSYTVPINQNSQYTPEDGNMHSLTHYKYINSQVGQVCYILGEKSFNVGYGLRKSVKIKSNEFVVRSR